MNKHSVESIDEAHFDELLKQYPDVVPAKLLGLDTQRYETIPRLLQDQDEPKSLQKDQVATLVDWKLYVKLLRSFLVCIPRGTHRNPFFPAVRSTLITSCRFTNDQKLPRQIQTNSQSPRQPEQQRICRRNNKIWL